MKRWVLPALLVWVAGSAQAQLAGVPIAGGVEAIPSLQARLGGGVVWGDDYNLYGVRGDLGLVENLSLFADVGLIDPDDGSTDLALQGGGWFTLPVDMPLDVAVRGALGKTRFSVKGGSVHLLTYNVGVVASKQIGILIPYTFFGVNHAKERIRIKEHGRATERDTDLAVAAGLSLDINRRITVYAELSHVDDGQVSFGGRYTF